MSLANTQVPVLKGSSKPREAAPEIRNSQTRGSKFQRIVWAHCLGSELQPGVRIAVPPSGARLRGERKTKLETWVKQLLSQHHPSTGRK